MEMMALSNETLCEGYLLILLEMPVHIIAKLLEKLGSKNENESESGEQEYVLEV